VSDRQLAQLCSSPENGSNLRDIRENKPLKSYNGTRSTAIDDKVWVVRYLETKSVAIILLEFRSRLPARDFAKTFPIGTSLMIPPNNRDSKKSLLLRKNCTNPRIWVGM
jgi:hypothetical protein